MGCLYIAGAQCVHAAFANPEDWEKFDEQQSALSKLAATFNVFVYRENMEDQEPPCFVVTNAAMRSNCFYEGAAFEADMSVKVSETFPDRVRQFIKALNDDAAFSAFHGLKWFGPNVLYFVSS